MGLWSKLRDIDNVNWILDGEWHHLVTIYDGKNFTHILDGEQID